MKRHLLIPADRQEAVGKLIRAFRKSRNIKLTAFRDLTNLSAGYLSYLETGRRGCTVKTLLQVSKAFNLSNEEHQQLFRSAGLLDKATGASDLSRQEVMPSWRQRLVEFVDETAQVISSPADQEMFLRDLNKALDQQRSNREIRRLLIPLSWQSHLLSEETTFRMIKPIIEESLLAGITTIGIVTPANVRSTFIKRIRESHGDLVFHHIFQEPKLLGLGASVLAARDFLNNQAFAVALPDIHIQQSEGAPLLASLRNSYAVRPRSLIAVRQATRLRYIRKGAVVSLDPLSEKDDARLHNVSRVAFKEVSPGEYYVLGRYILTNGVMNVLRSIPPDEMGFIRLGSALEGLLKDETIYAADFSDAKLNSFTVPQELFGEIINLAHNSDETRISATLDALTVQLAPWGSEVDVLESVISRLDPLLNVTLESEPLRMFQVLPLELKAIVDLLADKPFPYALWRECFLQIVKHLSELAIKIRGIRLPGRLSSIHQVFAGDARDFVVRFVHLLEQGHKSRASEALWIWPKSLELMRQRLESLIDGTTGWPPDLRGYLTRGIVARGER